MHASAAHRASPADGRFSADIKALARIPADIRPPRIVEVAGFASLLALAACSNGTVAGSQAAYGTVKTVSYQCQQDKTIVADYLDGPTQTAPDGRPIPGGRVVVALSDGRKFSLPQTLSGSGIRYADSSETFVFWSKGDTAFVEEGPNKAVTYKECVAKKG
jgi:membrane-bound inhibitor of C-type lysozyme